MTGGDVVVGWCAYQVDSRSDTARPPADGALPLEIVGLRRIPRHDAVDVVKVRSARSVRNPWVGNRRGATG